MHSAQCCMLHCSLVQALEHLVEHASPALDVIDGLLSALLHCRQAVWVPYGAALVLMLDARRCCMTCNWLLEAVVRSLRACLWVASIVSLRVGLACIRCPVVGTLHCAHVGSAGAMDANANLKLFSWGPFVLLCKWRELSPNYVNSNNIRLMLTTCMQTLHPASQDNPLEHLSASTVWAGFSRGCDSFPLSWP